MALAFGEFTYYPYRRELRKNGAVINVERQLLELLAYLLSRPQQLCTREELLAKIWGGRVVGNNVLSVAVSKLRTALGEVASTPSLVESRYGRGYLITSVVSEVSDTLRTNELRIRKPHAARANDLLVGRGQSLQQLENVLRDIDVAGGRLVAILGEPGVGKTRLTEVFASSASSRGATTVWGHFQSDGSAPLCPLAQIFQELGSVELAKELRRSPVLSSAHRNKNESHGLDHRVAAASSDRHLLDKMADEFCGLSRSQRPIIFLENLQWADSASFRLLAHIADNLRRWPVMIVVTLRLLDRQLDDVHHHDLMRLLCHRSCHQIQLEPLDEGAVGEYVDELLGPGPADLVSAVYERTDGNPLHMVELLSPWTVGGVERPAPEQLTLPPSVYEAVNNRLSLLTESLQRVLCSASVLGREFDLGLLSHVTQQPVLDLLDAMDAAMASQLVVPSGAVMTIFSFSRESFREVLYSSLPVSTRCSMHLQAAQAVRKRGVVERALDKAELARHLLAALPEGDPNEAIQLARAAALSFSRMGLHGEARGFLRGALAALRFLVGGSDETRAQLLIELAIVERTIGYPSYEEHLTKGVALAHKHVLGTLLAKAGCLLSPIPGFAARCEASQLLEAALETLPEANYRHRSIVLAHLAHTPPHCRSARHVDELLLQAEQLAQRSNDSRALLAVRSSRLLFLSGPPTQHLAEALADEMERDERAQVEHTGRILRHGRSTIRMTMAIQRGDVLAFQQLLESRGAELSALNCAVLDWNATRFQVIQKMNRAEFKGVVDVLFALRRSADELREESGFRLFALDYRMLQTWTRGNVDRSRRIPSANLSLPSDSLHMVAFKLRSMVEDGFVDEARASMSAIDLDALSDIPRDIDYLVVLVHYAVASVATRSAWLCAALYDLLAPYSSYYAIGTSFHAYGSVAHTLGCLARELGRTSAALEHFEYAELRHKELGWSGWLARSRVEHARDLLAVGTTRASAQAVALLHSAMTVARSAGLKPLVLKIGRMLNS